MAKKENISDQAAKGGKARAKALTSQRRSEIARQAVIARWSKQDDLPRASHDGPLSIGEITFDAAVLEDGTRVISEAKFMEAMGIYRSGALSTRRSNNGPGAHPPLSLAHKNLKPFVEKHFGGVHYDPLKYRTKQGNAANGIKAEALPKICEVWLDARKAGVLGPTQERIADNAELLLRGFAHVGIIALIDEATGYQYERQKTDLQDFLREFLSEELRSWVKTFPNEYFKELCRLRNITYRPDMKLPPYFGHLTNNLVYRRLAPYVLEELQERNPTKESGRRKARHHQWLSESSGHPRLIQHLGMIIGLAKISNEYDEFEALVNRAAPMYHDLPLLRPIYEKEREDQ